MAWCWCNATESKPQNVTANAKKTTTVNKLNDRNKMPTAHSGTFACPNTRATASQSKEPEFSCPQDPNTNDSEFRQC